MNRALLVGINAYPDPQNVLRGCVNDINNMSDHLQSNFNFANTDVQLLTDGGATRQAIMDNLNQLVVGAKAGDRLLFHYSGHGAEFPITDAHGNITDIQDVICPVNFDWSVGNTIFSSDFKNIFAGVADGVEFIWVSDSCYSGGLLAKLMLKKYRKAKTILPPAEMLLKIEAAKRMGLKSRSLARSIEDLQVALISGCTAHQESADADIDGTYNGALTYYLLKQLDSAGGMTSALTSIVTNVNSDLSTNGYSQSPEILGSTAIGARAFLQV